MSVLLLTIALEPDPQVTDLTSGWETTASTAAADVSPHRTAPGLFLQSTPFPLEHVPSQL